MCYPKPGPRCTPHARKQLQAAQNKWNETKDFSAYEALRHAQEEYDKTPGGQKELEEKIAEASSQQEATELEARLSYAIDSRKKALDVIKAEDKGDVAHVEGGTDKAEPESEQDKAKRLQGLSPSEVDTELSEIYREGVQAAAEVERQKRYLNDAEEGRRKYLAGNLSYYSYRDEGTLDRYRDKVEAAQDKLQRISDQMEVYNDEFKRRGGWTRAFLVTNGNGHVRKTMECNTCYSTTSFAWLPSESGKDESEIIDAAGEKACTVCYPNAPVDVLRRPSRLEDPAVKQARAERDTARKERQQKKIAAGLTEDGSPFEIQWEAMSPGWDYDKATRTRSHSVRMRPHSESFKTARTATSWYVESRATAKRLGMRLPNEENPDGSFVDWEWQSREKVLEALAKKEGKSVEEMRTLLDKKVAAYAKRQGW